MNIYTIKRNIGKVRKIPTWGWIAGVLAKTANYTIRLIDWGQIFTNTGAAAAVTYTLPAPEVGLVLSFVKTVINQNLIVTRSGTAAVRSAGGTGVTLTNSTNTEHASLTLYSDGINWYVLFKEGTWALT